MIDLKHEIERELGMIEAPDLWDRIEAEALNDGLAPVRDLTTAAGRRRTSRWLVAVAAVAVLLLVGSAVAWLGDDHQSLDTMPIAADAKAVMSVRKEVKSFECGTGVRKGPRKKGVRKKKPVDGAVQLEQGAPKAKMAGEPPNPSGKPKIVIQVQQP